jgi:dienelactone hydrolase
MMHICEELASMGFVVAAPEMPESLSASYEPNERVQRSCIVDETIGMMQRNFGVGDNLGIFGHSAGGGTSTNVAGPFKLGRCAIAGFRGYGGTDPLLVVASVGDGIIPLDGIKSALPPGESIRTRKHCIMRTENSFSAFQWGARCLVL